MDTPEEAAAGEGPGATKSAARASRAARRTTPADRRSRTDPSEAETQRLPVGDTAADDAPDSDGDDPGDSGPADSDPADSDPANADAGDDTSDNAAAAADVPAESGGEDSGGRSDRRQGRSADTEGTRVPSAVPDPPVATAKPRNLAAEGGRGGASDGDKAAAGTGRGDRPAGDASVDGPGDTGGRDDGARDERAARDDAAGSGAGRGGVDGSGRGEAGEDAAAEATADGVGVDAADAGDDGGISGVDTADAEAVDAGADAADAGGGDARATVDDRERSDGDADARTQGSTGDDADPAEPEDADSVAVRGDAEQAAKGRDGRACAPAGDSQAEANRDEGDAGGRRDADTWTASSVAERLDDERPSAGLLPLPGIPHADLPSTVRRVEPGAQTPPRPSGGVDADRREAAATTEGREPLGDGRAVDTDATQVLKAPTVTSDQRDRDGGRAGERAEQRHEADKAAGEASVGDGSAKDRPAEEEPTRHAPDRAASDSLGDSPADAARRNDGAADGAAQSRSGAAKAAADADTTQVLRRPSQGGRPAEGPDADATQVLRADAAAPAEAGADTGGSGRRPTGRGGGPYNATPEKDRPEKSQPGKADPDTSEPARTDHGDAASGRADSDRATAAKGSADRRSEPTASDKPDSTETGRDKERRGTPESAPADSARKRDTDGSRDGADPDATQVVDVRRLGGTDRSSTPKGPDADATQALRLAPDRQPIPAKPDGERDGDGPRKPARPDGGDDDATVALSTAPWNAPEDDAGGRRPSTPKGAADDRPWTPPGGSAPRSGGALVPAGGGGAPVAAPPTTTAPTTPEPAAVEGISLTGAFGEPAAQPQRLKRRVFITASALVVLLLAGILVQLLRPLPNPRVSVSIPASYVLPGDAPTMPWPKDGQAAMEVEGVGSFAGSTPTETPAPIASITKVMTAYVVLSDHPLNPGEDGPVITVTPAEAAEYAGRVQDGQSLVPVAPNEQLTERQALIALMLPSADNMADILARWDAGNIQAFVSKMNAAARTLDMTKTTYTGASGLDSSTRSTPSDLIRLGEQAMRNPALVEIMSLRSATIPVAGQVTNVNNLVGRDGVVGIKTGSTTPAGGCLLFAAKSSVNGKDYMIIGAVLGQRGSTDLNTELANALNASRELISSAGTSLQQFKVIPAGTVVGHIDQYGRGPVDLVTTADLNVVGWAGMGGQVHVVGLSVPRDAASGTRVGSLQLVADTIGGDPPPDGDPSVPVVTRGSLQSPSLIQRLTRF